LSQLVLWDSEVSQATIEVNIETYSKKGINRSVELMCEVDCDIPENLKKTNSFSN